jgi:Arc/MetJ family transcription regulator
VRTTLDLPDDLVSEARRLAGVPTKRGVVVAALEEFIRARRRARLVSMLGNTDLDLTQEDLERMRADDEEGSADEPLRLMVPSDRVRRKLGAS